MTESAGAKRHDVVIDAAPEVRIRGCLRRERSARERLAGHLYARPHPVMAALGLLFLVLVLARSEAQQGTGLHVVPSV